MMYKSEKTRFQKFAEFGGWIGMLLIQSSTLPVSFSIMNGTAERIPQTDMILMVWIGLFLFLLRAVSNKDTLYTVSNSVGFFFQSILLILIVFK